MGRAHKVSPKCHSLVLSFRHTGLYIHTESMRHCYYLRSQHSGVTIWTPITLLWCSHRQQGVTEAHQAQVKQASVTTPKNSFLHEPLEGSISILYTNKTLSYESPLYIVFELCHLRDTHLIHWALFAVIIIIIVIFTFCLHLTWNMVTDKYKESFVTMVNVRKLNDISTCTIHNAAQVGSSCHKINLQNPSLHLKQGHK